MKFWTGDAPKDDRILAFSDNIIYKGKPNESDLQQVINELHSGNIPVKDFTGFPVSYIREIRMTEGKKYIELIMGKDAYEELKIEDDYKRDEIFSFLKNQFPLGKYVEEKYSVLKAGKKPLIAMAVITALFLYTVHIAVQIENGSEYDVSNGHYGSLAGIVLWLALWGVTKTCLVFGSLFMIAAAGFYFKVRKIPVMKSIFLR